MVVITPVHQALWLRAAAHTKPGTVSQKPTYGAWHRQKAERIIEAEPEAEAPKELDGLAVTG